MQKIRRQTPAARSVADAAVLMVAHAIAPADKYFSLDSMDSLVTTPYPTVFLMQAFPYRSSAPRVWDLSKPPVTYQEAMARPDCDAWRVVMDTEKSAMDDLGVLDSAPVLVLPKGKNAIGLHWVFVGKDVEDSKIAKARIVTQGHLQRPDDYGNMYAPVAKMTSIRVVLAYTAREDLELYTFDVRTTFLNRDVHRIRITVATYGGYGYRSILHVDSLDKTSIPPMSTREPQWPPMITRGQPCPPMATHGIPCSSVDGQVDPSNIVAFLTVIIHGILWQKTGSPCNPTQSHRSTCHW